MQSLEQLYLMLDENDTEDVTEVVFTAGVADVDTLLQLLNVYNNSVSEQSVTVSLQKYISTAYVDVFEQAYTVAAGAVALITDLMGHTLKGAASNPDRLVMEFDTALGASETITFLGSAVTFQEA